MTAADHPKLRPVTAAPHRALVELHGVSKVYSNGTTALANLSLSVKRGEFLSLLGPSGCGKSTALRLIAGLARPTTGSIAWAPETSINAKGMPRGGIGFVFQDPTLMPWQTVFGNVYLPLRLGGMNRRAATPAVREALVAVGLEDVEEAYPRELSGGMRMRVSIARALVSRPRLLLMDEPFAALDEITRHRLNDDLLSLWDNSGVSIVFVTHSVFESTYLSSRVVVLTPRPGRVAAEIPGNTSALRSENHRSTEAYRALTERVSLALRDAMQDGEAS